MVTRASIRRIGCGTKCFAIAAAVIASALRMHAQANPSVAHGGQSVSFAYDVVSIRPHPPDAEMDWRWGITPDGFSGTMPIKMLVLTAYGLRIDDQIIGLPKWAETGSYDIQAKMDNDAVAAFQKLDEEEAAKQRQLMLQQLLADRFQLKVHQETKNLPIYNLVIAKDGPKLKEAAADAKRGSGWGKGRFGSDNARIAVLATALSDELGRLVTDKTGLTGQYAIKLHWTPDDRQETADSGPSIFAALEEQLGLKLVSAKGPVDVIVVDRVEKPSEN